MKTAIFVAAAALTLASAQAAPAGGAPGGTTSPSIAQPPSGHTAPAIAQPPSTPADPQSATPGKPSAVVTPPECPETTACPPQPSPPGTPPR